MPAALFERELIIPSSPKHRNLVEGLGGAVTAQIEEGDIPIRLAVTTSAENSYHCEMGLLSGLEYPSKSGWESMPESGWNRPSPAPLFRFVRRPVENTAGFSAVLLVPTGIGAEIGGHAGDAAPVASLLASVCDTLITHPNVVNASDIIDLPANALYVEGSVITRMLMGTLGLQQARNNRLLVVIGHHEDELFTHAAINSVNAARSSYGLTVSRIIQLGPEFEMDSCYTGSGRAAGRVRGLDCLFEALDEYAGQYDAVAITSQIIVPLGYHADYFNGMGAMVNPWGGVEAMLTHAVSTIYDVPSAHSPMLETREIANEDPGIVDPRMAAEAVSLALLQCILKGLQKSPKIITDANGMMHHSVLTAADISCLVIPDGCIGLPTLAALEQGIPVIAVRENHNLMRNDLAALPWATGQLHLVENYWEAAGVMAAMRAGINPAAVRRPILPSTAERWNGRADKANAG